MYAYVRLYYERGMGAFCGLKSEQEYKITAVVIFSTWLFTGLRYIESQQCYESTCYLQTCLINIRATWLPNIRIVVCDKHNDLCYELPVILMKIVSPGIYIDDLKKIRG